MSTGRPTSEEQSTAAAAGRCPIEPSCTDPGHAYRAAPQPDESGMKRKASACPHCSGPLGDCWCPPTGAPAGTAGRAATRRQLARVLLAHHTVREPGGPSVGCECGRLQPGQPWSFHVADELLSGPLAALADLPRQLHADPRRKVRQALNAADAGSAYHWPTIAATLADEVRRLRALTPDPSKEQKP